MFESQSTKSTKNSRQIRNSMDRARTVYLTQQLNGLVVSPFKVQLCANFQKRIAAGVGQHLNMVKHAPRNKKLVLPHCMFHMRWWRCSNNKSGTQSRKHAKTVTNDTSLLIQNTRAWAWCSLTAVQCLQKALMCSLRQKDKQPDDQQHSLKRGCTHWPRGSRHHHTNLILS